MCPTSPGSLLREQLAEGHVPGCGAAERSSSSPLPPLVPSISRGHPSPHRSTGQLRLGDPGGGGMPMGERRNLGWEFCLDRCVPCVACPPAPREPQRGWGRAECGGDAVGPGSESGARRGGCGGTAGGERSSTGGDAAGQRDESEERRGDAAAAEPEDGERSTAWGCCSRGARVERGGCCCCCGKADGQVSGPSSPSSGDRRGWGGGAREGHGGVGGR